MNTIPGRMNPLESANMFGRIPPGVDTSRSANIPLGNFLSPNYTGSSGKFNFPPAAAPVNPPISPLAPSPTPFIPFSDSTAPGVAP